MNALLLLLGNATANTAAHLCLKRSAISSRARLFLLWQVAGNLVAFAGTVAYTAFLRHVSLHAAYPLSEGLTAHRRAGRGEPHRVPRTDQPPGLGGDGIDRPWYSALQSLNKGGRRMADQRRFMEELRRAWRDEKAAALTYAAAADKETDPRRRDIFLRMAAEEQRHAERWETRLRELGEAPGEYRETETEAQKRRELVAKDPVTIASTMAAAESSADGGYDVLASLAPTEKDRTAFLDAGRAERAHDRVLKDMASTAGHPRSVLDTILGRERHVRGGGWIGQAIYGINDGLGAAFGVVSGVAGATHVNSNFVLLSGFASMIASALSMGSGAYLATKSEKEVHEAELSRERKEIKEHPEEEQEELSLFPACAGRPGG